MDKELLRRVQLVQLEMLKEIKRVCHILKIDYFLDSGTLLGAIRHNGFIPWDDDLDVGMTRENYERFLQEAPAVLDKKYFLQSWYSDEYYGLPFAKLRKNNTIYIENNAHNSKAHNGFYVDIFPYDVYPNDERIQSHMAKKLDFIKRSILIKNGYSPFASDGFYKKTLKTVLYLPIDLFAILNSRKKLIEKYEKCKTMCNDQETEYYAPASGATNFGKWLIPQRCFLEYGEHVFEDDIFSVPCDCDTYLKHAYGDYMTLPPEEQRGNRHNIIKVKF